MRDSRAAVLVFGALAVSCKGTPPCPSRDEALAVATGIDTANAELDAPDREAVVRADIALQNAVEAEAERTGLPHASPKGGATDVEVAFLVEADARLGDRLRELAAQNGALARSDLRAAFVQAEQAAGLDPKVGSAFYDAHAAAIDAYLLGRVVAVRTPEFMKVLDRSRQCAGR